MDWFACRNSYRFQGILRSLHFADNDAVLPGPRNRFGKLGEFLPSILASFQGAVNAGQDLTIDETLLAFLGRLSFKQYNSKKRGRFGIKMFLLADTRSGFILDCLPYQGKYTQVNNGWKAEYGFGGAVVLALLEPHQNLWHRVTLDNYFMSYKLVQKLLELKTHSLGTVLKNRKGIPKMSGKLNKGAIETFSDGRVLLER